MFKRIVVPLDGSQVAQRALERAKEMSKLYEAPLFLVRVTDAHWPAMVGQVGTGGMRPVAMTSQTESSGDEDDAKVYIDGMVRQLELDGHKASGVVLRGRPADAIGSVLNESDLLVMSSHGRTGVRRWLLGSVAEDVVKRSSVTIVLDRST